MRLLVVQLAMAIKHVLLPVAGVCDIARLIVQYAVAVHLVVEPVSFIHSSVLIEELAFSMSHAITLKALIA